MKNLNILREWIKFLIEKDVIGEPDLSNKEERDKDIAAKKKEKESPDEASVAAGMPGVSTPLGTGPTYPAKIVKKTKKRQKRK